MGGSLELREGRCGSGARPGLERAAPSRGVWAGCEFGFLERDGLGAGDDLIRAVSHSVRSCRCVASKAGEGGWSGEGGLGRAGAGGERWPLAG